jgi:hypothetical protein
MIKKQIYFRRIAPHGVKSNQRIIVGPDQKPVLSIYVAERIGDLREKQVWRTDDDGKDVELLYATYGSVMLEVLAYLNCSIFREIDRERFGSHFMQVLDEIMARYNLKRRGS